MSEDLLPTISKRQRELQDKILNQVVVLDESVTNIDSTLRDNITELRKISKAIKDNEPGVSDFGDTGDQGDGPLDIFIQEVIKELEQIGQDTLLRWMSPGKGVTLFNRTTVPIVVRTYDQKDGLRWIPYGTYSLRPSAVANIFARGDSYIQANINGKLVNVNLGVPNVYNGNDVIPAYAPPPR